MATRTYNNQTRLQQQAETRQRIAQAAAELHASQGALATSYAQVAERAGVSLPTVYKNFPTLDDLIVACTGHAASLAPPLPRDKALAAPDLASAVDAVVEGADAIHEFYAPWDVWREQSLVKALGAFKGRQRDELFALCRDVLAHHLGPGNHKATAAWWEALLSFDVRDRIVRQQGVSRSEYRRRMASLLLAVAGPQPAASKSSRPQRKS